MNNVCLVGRVTKEIELQKVGPKEVAKVDFDLAVDRNYKNNNGEKITDFLKITAWRSLAENVVAKYVNKGDRIGVVGSIETDSYEKDGKTVYVTYIVASDVELIENKKDNQEKEEQK